MAGITGVREGPTRRDEETVALLFDTMSLSADRDPVLRRPAVFQWEFTDPDIADWHIVVDNGSTRAERGPRRHTPTFGCASTTRTGSTSSAGAWIRAARC